MFYIILSSCLKAVELEMKRLPPVPGHKLTDYQVALQQAQGILRKLMQFN